MFNLSMKAILGGALATAVVLAVASMWLFGWGFFQRETADFRGETDVIEQVSADAGYRIGAYEAFYDRCHAIKAKEGEIALAEEILAGTDKGDWNYTQLERNLLALKNSRIELIEAYNADARKEDTAANFLASDLPHELTIEGATECTA